MLKNILAFSLVGILLVFGINYHIKNIGKTHIYRGAEYYEAREILARNKDFFNVHMFKPEPKFLGPTISIYGDGRETHD